MMSGRFARKAYRRKPFDGGAMLFRAGAEPVTPDHQYAEWPNMVTGGVETRIVPGHHGSILLDPNVQIIASVLDIYLSLADDDP